MTAQLQQVTVVRDGYRLLDAVSMSIDSGEFLGVVGPNGAGKSTLLRVLAGDIDPAAGGARLLGTDVASAPLRHLADLRSFVGPQTVSDVSFTVRDVVEMGRHRFEAGVADADGEGRLVAAAMVRADVGHLADRSMRTLSSGEQQRVALARAIAQQTPVMLLDEPTSALDVGHQEIVMEVLRQVAGEGAAVVAVLHDLNLAAAYADQVALLDEGRVVALGGPRDVLTDELLSAVYRRPIRVIDHPFRDCPLVLTAG